ncbi:GrpB family protein [Paenibacillus radicis (ex Xue et al. 2023)]|uniref:GrpB family protein n=1 Tax=Paenibacillus radicis (ex Xue et al. 2023) TaxID=2972489 RepID=A0ABT1YKT1_9BACL|nr:GrpB family protein [Paenibacillus radicis (ex Xue et al. 2023)]MCR8633789.1 GrpB family protein [Paenibacillus radicis (ex Xue et al. 2023)]
MVRKTAIEPWTEDWIQRYQSESELLAAILKENVVEIYHIGSTSVPQIGFAKPIVDILISALSIEQIDFYNETMTKHGYQPRGENGIAGRRYFIKGDPRIVHLHIYQQDDPHIKDHLDFKHYMIAHPENAAKYGELKLWLAKRYPDNTHLYQKNKEAFVSEMVDKAREWAKT